MTSSQHPEDSDSEGSDPEDHAGLLQRLDLLERRVTDLEARTVQPSPPDQHLTPPNQQGPVNHPTSPNQSSNQPSQHAPVQEEDEVFWALEGLRARVPHPGAVMLVGSVHTPNGVEARWQTGSLAQDFFDSDFADRAEALSALAHPARLRIIQRLMTDAVTVHDLAATEEFGTSGQIYHHLKQLVSTGWLRTAGRGRYEVPVDRIVPLLGILQGVDR